MTTTLPDNKCLGTVFNNDINNIILGMGATGTVDTYRQTLDAILAAQPGVFAQDVGLPEALLYPTAVDNMFDKHLVEVAKQAWPEREQAVANAEAQAAFMGKVRAASTDLLTVTIEACRQRSVPVVADYRMNAEDWYVHTYRLSDFGRARPEWRIPLDPEAQPRTDDTPPEQWAGCLDPAIPAVFAHRLAIFTEVADRYDIDGIEFDFRRWYRMISDPRRNYAILTRLVAQTRAMLDETARRKGRDTDAVGRARGSSARNATERSGVSRRRLAALQPVVPGPGAGCTHVDRVGTRGLCVSHPLLATLARLAAHRRVCCSGPRQRCRHLPDAVPVARLAW